MRCASETATAVILTMSLTSHPGTSKYTGLRIPNNIGPIAVAPPSFARTLYAMFADVKSGHINTFASPLISLNGKTSETISGSNAVSAIISPSTTRLGAFFLIISTAFLTFSVKGCCVLPKLLKDNIATGDHMMTSAGSLALAEIAALSKEQLDGIRARYAAFFTTVAGALDGQLLQQRRERPRQYHLPRRQAARGAGR